MRYYYHQFWQHRNDAAQAAVFEAMRQKGMVRRDSLEEADVLVIRVPPPGKSYDPNALKLARMFVTAGKSVFAASFPGDVVGPRSLYLSKVDSYTLTHLTMTDGLWGNAEGLEPPKPKGRPHLTLVPARVQGSPAQQLESR